MLTINPTIFKAYDIRGVYPGELSEETAFRLGRALADLIIKETRGQGINIVVGRDMRLSSPALAAKVMAGIIEQGVNVADIGLVSTPTFYFAVAKYGFDAGIQVSASHNPAQYNGFKMVRRNAIPISGDTGIMDLRDAVMANEFKSAPAKGLITEKHGAIEDHVKYALTQVDLSKIKPLKVAVDTANAMGGPLFEKLFNELPCEFMPLNLELDGTFPNHEADPLKDENNQQLQAEVLRTRADLGIALDGDGDRIFFVDNTGRTVEPAIIRGILSKIFLRGNPGAKICYDIRPGRITIDMINEAGGEPVVTKVGHSLIKEKAREIGAVFAGESSGHFFVKMPFGIFEMPMIMALKILQELSESGLSLADYIKPLQRYHHSGEINFEVADKELVLKRLRETYQKNLQYDFDGLSFEWPEWWFNVRASNTENKLRLNLEARTPELMAQKRDEVAQLIKS